MTQDEIRKLLGGYATNALSAEERRILFDAALEDQELFNALQNEDALRELLEDPVLRDQVRRALAASPPRKAEFSWRRWVLGVAIPAVVAVIVIVVMNLPRRPEAVQQHGPERATGTKSNRSAAIRCRRYLRPLHPRSNPRPFGEPLPHQ